MKKLLLLTVFILSFVVFLYFTFPIEKFAEHYLCKKLSFKEIAVKRVPLELVLKKVEHPEIPVTINKVVVSPEILSLSSDVKKFFVKLILCGGYVEGKVTYPLSKVSFKVVNFKVDDCKFYKPLELSGLLSGRGTLVFEKENLIGGSGNFRLKNFNIKTSKLFPLVEEFQLQDAKVKYKVEKENKVNFKMESSKVSMDGYVNLNLKNIYNSYLSVNLKLNFNWQNLSFKLKGFINRLSVE
ncbi:MAG: hypothetical protein ABGX27_06225 [Desulfurobacteriaceae bacterium]